MAASRVTLYPIANLLRRPPPPVWGDTNRALRVHCGTLAQSTFATVDVTKSGASVPQPQPTVP